MSLHTLLALFPFAMLACFLLYWAGARHAWGRRETAPPGDASAFAWHFFVPCRDEETVVGTTVDQLRADFPEAHVWVIDDDSEDRTGALVAARAEHDRRVHLVSRRRPDARVGKGAALNAAYAELDEYLPAGTDRSRVVVCVVDADGRLAPDALRLVGGAHGFGDPEIGGVQVSVRMRNVEDPEPLPERGRVRNAFARLLIRAQDMEFAVANAGMQMLRIRTGSVGLGGNGQFTRLSALDAVAAHEQRPWQRDALLEDYELGLNITLRGHRITHLTDTFVTQEGLPHLRRFLTQRTRWAQGNLQCMRYGARIAGSRQYKGKGVLETLYTFFQPFTHLAALLLTVVITAGLLLDGASLLPGSWPLALLFAAGTIVPFTLWGPAYRRAFAPDASRLTGVLWGLVLWLYAYHLFVVSARAFVRLLRGRNGWAKTRRNAEAVGIGPVAVEA
ncbi:glycosyltransferase family 2 protein [Streptomyces sp. NPDC001941]|uniref:glycosyltransferase family 2 protein n=1 Tax=Streptomyces sp. NPDC001941 TaxID=3154659 RepID=UPI00332A7C61